MVAQVFEFGIGQHAAVAAFAADGHAVHVWIGEDNEPAGIRNWQRASNTASKIVKMAVFAPDAQSEGEDGDQRKARIFTKVRSAKRMSCSRFFTDTHPFPK